MASFLGGKPRPLSAFRLIVALLFAGPMFAGCGDKGFFHDVPLWKAGYGWEYDETVVDTEALRGDLPSIIDDEADANVQFQNNTVRLEVFNATASSVEGIPIYALAVLNRYYPEDNETPPDSIWDAWVFSADINKVEPTYLDWRNQEIQLSGVDEEPADDAGDGGNGLNVRLADVLFQEEPAEGDGSEPTVRPEFEDRRLDWPLEKGHEWRHPEPVPLLGGAEGVFEGVAVRQYKERVPAGNYTAILIEGKLTADDLSAQEEDVRTSLEAFGGEVDAVNVNYATTYTYGYAPEVLNVVYYRQVDRYSIHARGEDGDGQKYDFTFSKEVITTRELFKFQLTDGLEKPLTFALDVKRGAYEPKPITPASHLAVEIITSRDALNKAEDETVFFGVRIYNSTAAEKPIRGPEAKYAEVGQEHFSPKYDHDLLEIQWTFHNILPNDAGIGPQTEVLNVTGDQQSVNGATFDRYGLKTVTATLKLKDTNGPGQHIFTDIVLFEVYMRTNMTGMTNATDAPPQPIIRVPFPVEHTATRVTIVGDDPQLPPEGECVFLTRCIYASDAGNRPVTDDRGEPMTFESTRLNQFIKGTWMADYRPAHASQSMVFDITVRYRAGA
ncbi:MAG TPA: hypothetical protein VGB18_04610 [Candidatus Thermoplasmatota archaeon]